MNFNIILMAVEAFLSLAEAEELPENSKDLKIIKKNLEELQTFNARKKYAEKNLKHSGIITSLAMMPA